MVGFVVEPMMGRTWDGHHRRADAMVVVVVVVVVVVDDYPMPMTSLYMLHLLRRPLLLMYME